MFFNLVVIIRTLTRVQTEEERDGFPNNSSRGTHFATAQEEGYRRQGGNVGIFALKLGFFGIFEGDNQSFLSLRRIIVQP